MMTGNKLCTENISRSPSGPPPLMKEQKSPDEHLLQGFLPQSALLLAAADEENILEIKKALQSVDLNQKDQHGKTPLLVALMTGNLVLVKILLDLGANIHCSSRVRP